MGETLQACKPDSVSAVAAAIIYLLRALLPGCICLPTNIGRAALGRWYTWHFSTQGLPAVAITSNSRGLLPHVFILTPTTPEGEEEAVIFCGTVSFFFQRSRLLAGALLCAVRTFLLPPSAGIDSAACSDAKVGFIVFLYG